MLTPLLWVSMLFGIAIVTNQVAVSLVQQRRWLGLPLPLTGGAWLKGELAALGPGAPALIVADADGHVHDCFHPEANVIQLRVDTYFGTDPAAWATAGHELGHALWHRRHPRLGRWSRAARPLLKTLTLTGFSITAGNLLYALAGAGTLARGCFALELVLAIPVMLDELAATWWAARALRRSLPGDPDAQRTGRRKLALAFATYVAVNLDVALALAVWPMLVPEAPRVPPVAHLTSFGIILAALATIPVLVGTARALRAGASTTSRVASGHPGAWQLAGAITLVVLGWNLDASRPFAWCALLAFVPLAPFVVIALALPPTIYAMRAFGGDKVPSVRLGAEDRTYVAHGNRVVRELPALVVRVDVANRVTAAVQLLYAPFVFAVWHAILG